MQNKPHVFFDMDGTIVDSIGIYGDLIAEFSTARHLPYDIAKLVAGYTHADVRDMGWGIALHEQSAMYQEMVAYHINVMDQQKRFVPEMYPDMKDVITRLGAEYDMSIITANTRPVTDKLLDIHGLLPYFPSKRTMCCAKERQYGLKPKPDALLCLARETGADLGRSVMIGDSPNDINMAHAAGIPSIAVDWGHASKEKLLQFNPTLFVEKVTELPQAIERIFTPR